MVKKLTGFLFLTILSSSLAAAPAQIVHEEIVDGAENYAFIDPVLNAQNELSGFIYTDSSNRKVIVDYINSDSSIVIDIPDSPVKAIHDFTLNDTLVVFTITSRSASPGLYVTKIIDNQIITHTQYEIGTYYIIDPSMIDISTVNLNIKFSYDNLIIEATNRYTLDYGGMGLVQEDVPTTAVYDKRTLERIDSYNSSHLYSGRLSETDMSNMVTIKNKYYHYDFTERINQNTTDSRSAELTIYDDFGFDIFNYMTEDQNIYTVFVNNFQPSSPEDELILYSNSNGLLRDHFTDTLHIGCYSFFNGIPSEIWYNDKVGKMTLSYVFNRKDLLVGIRDNAQVIMLDYLNGQLSDSAALGREVTNINFFESGLEFPVLNMVSTSKDTIFVYQFDLPTSIPGYSTPDAVVPSSFTLFQNHPNPFNGETRLEFTNEQYQRLTLKVYNILGQEIKLITDGTFGPGDYSFYWNGTDENGLSQSTGVYFARLESSSSSQMIKLIYVK